MKTKSLIDFCAFCPKKHEGLCKNVLEILGKESKSHSPSHYSLPSKHYLFHQGDQLDKNYILRDGWILLTKMSVQGKRQVIRSVLPGDLIGFQPNMPASSVYSAIAVQDSIVCNIPDIIEMCNHHPQLALKLISVKAYDITLTELYMINIAHCSAHEKVAFMALELYQRLKLRGLNNGYIIPCPLTQGDIADMLGLTTIHVNRTLHKLEHEQLISLHNHKLTILDYGRLDAMVGDELKYREKDTSHGKGCKVYFKS